MAKAGDGKPRSSKRRATKHVTKRMTPEAFADLERRAEQAGYPSGKAFLDAFVLGDAHLTENRKRDLRRALGHLGKVGSNLNQLAHQANKGTLRGIGPDERRIIEETAAAVRTVSLDILSELGE